MLCLLLLTALQKALLTFIGGFEFQSYRPCYLPLLAIAYDLVNRTTVFDDLFLFSIPLPVPVSVSVPVFRVSSCPSVAVNVLAWYRAGCNLTF